MLLGDTCITFSAILPVIKMEFHNFAWLLKFLSKNKSQIQILETYVIGFDNRFEFWMYGAQSGWIKKKQVPAGTLTSTNVI